MTDWEQRYLDLAKHISTWSKDPSRQIGAVVVGDSGQILSIGYNGFPRGINDDERLHDRETKYSLVVHAEMNVIYNATFNGVSLDGASLYVYGLPVCSECAKGIIQKGIKEVVTTHPDLDRTHNNLDVSLQMFSEAGVKIKFISINFKCTFGIISSIHLLLTMQL